MPSSRPKHTSGIPSLVLVVLLIILTGCGAAAPSEALVELRQIAAGPALASTRETAPDLVAESARSLEASERALERGDQALSRRMATLGAIQARMAFAIARQHEARRREAAALAQLEGLEDEIASSRSRLEDATREIQRLEELGRGEAGSGGVGD